MVALKAEEFPSYTYQDYVQWEGDWELVDGIPYAMAPSPVKKHQKLMGIIFAQFFEKLKECKTCEVLIEEDWKIDEKNVLRPDVSIVCNDQNPNFIAKTPKIIFEIVSSSTALKDENIKFRIYQQEGVQYYILVYPDTLIAKIYKNENFQFKKVGEFDIEEYSFDLDGCTIDIDFNNIFEPFR